MLNRFAAIPLLLLPLLTLSACTTGSGAFSPSMKSTAPAPTPSATASPGQVLGSVTASTNEGEAVVFALPANGYKVQVLCEGDAKAKLRVSVRIDARKIDANHTIGSTTNSADIPCLSNKPYTLMSSGPYAKASATSTLLSLEVLSGTVSHASATAVAN